MIYTTDHRADRPLTRREHLWFAVVLAWITLTVALVTCVSCAGLASAPAAGRSHNERHNATVTIRTLCPDGGEFRGSGVVIDATRILTAQHVVECRVWAFTHTPYGLPVITVATTPPAYLAIDTGNGRPQSVSVDAMLPGRDIARLTLDRGTLDASLVTPVRIGATPDIGEVVCETASVPRWTVRCGMVQQPDTIGQIRFEMLVEHGNSGAGLYDARGDLIGIVVEQWTCERRSLCGGYGADLTHRAWVLH